MLEKMLLEAQRFVREMRTEGAPPRWLSFLGSSGTGKTFLARIINSKAVFPAPKVIGGFYPITYNCVWKWKKIINRLLGGDYGLRETLSEQHFLVLDDIGSARVRPTDFMAEELFDLLDSRLNKWTVITANIPLKTIGEQYEARTASRLARDGNICVACDTIDYALRQK